MVDQTGIVPQPLSSRTQTEHCARLMSSTDPWVTLGRPYETCLSIMMDPAKEVHVLLDGNEVTAFLILDMRGWLRGYIQTVCVAPTHQRRGLGSALIHWAEARILRESPNVFLCVSSFNQDAQKLYARLGYEVVGRLRDYLVPGLDEILMRKTIGAWSSFQPK